MTQRAIPGNRRKECRGLTDCQENLSLSEWTVAKGGDLKEVSLSTGQTRFTGHGSCLPLRRAGLGLQSPSSFRSRGPGRTQSRFLTGAVRSFFDGYPCEQPAAEAKRRRLILILGVFAGAPQADAWAGL